jgi:transcriptional regulator with XRE-family HTH domain
LDNINKIYERIESLYLEKGLTRKQFETELGLPQSFLSELKSGRTKVPSAKRLQKIAEYFDVRDGYLLGDDEGKDFDEFTAKLDFKNLSNIIKELDSTQLKTLVVSLIDEFYLLINIEIQQRNKEKLEMYYNLIRNLFLLKMSIKELNDNIFFKEEVNIEKFNEKITDLEKQTMKNINDIFNSITLEIPFDYSLSHKEFSPTPYEQDIIEKLCKLDPAKRNAFLTLLK